MTTTEATMQGFPDVSFEVEMLGPRIGRVVDASAIFNIIKPGTVVNPLLENDIVRLSHDPGESDGLPRLVEVAYKAGPRFLSKVECHTDDQLYRLIAVAQVVGGRVHGTTIQNRTGVIELWALHAEEIDFPGIVEAAGLTRGAYRHRSPPSELCKIPFFDEDQADRMIALAVLLGAEVMYVTDEPGEVVLFHHPDIDIRAVADAAGVTRNREEVELDSRVPARRPGAAPGPEWESGVWGSFDEVGAGSAGLAGEKAPAERMPQKRGDGGSQDG